MVKKGYIYFTHKLSRNILLVYKKWRKTDVCYHHRRKSEQNV